MSDPRAVVQRFARAMEVVLADNDLKGGWQDCPIDWLFARLIQEAGELAEAQAEADFHKMAMEAIDVANFAMMIADRSGWLDDDEIGEVNRG